MDTNIVITERRQAVAILFFNRAPVNALSGAMRTAIFDAVAAALEDPTVEGLVLSTDHLPFSAGADIKEFSQGYLGKTFLDLYALFSTAKKPIVAGIRHYALGGGLELAMLCHYRIALAQSKLGQPEIKLGIIPGGTGTQSLPRLVGVEKACDMILSGKPITADQGLAYGLVDLVVEDDLIQHACDFVQQVLDSGKPLVVPMQRGFPIMPSPDYFANQRAHIKSISYGFQAPLDALACIQMACEESIETALADESRRFMALMTGPASHAMRYQFMAEHLARQVPNVHKDTPTTTISSVGIVGGGLMGCGIAIVCASKHYSVRVVEKDSAASVRCQSHFVDYYDQAVQKGKLTAEQARVCMEKISMEADLSALKDCDLVIEAVFEDMRVKEDVFKALDAICKPSCILASNTSGLDINRIAQQTKRPDKVLGLHFFSPAPVMRLLEVVRAQLTPHETLATALSFAKHIRKIAVCVNVCPGFVGNRMLVPYFREVEQLLLEGVKPDVLDKALTQFGFAMGPCQMADMSGLDISTRLIPGDTLAQVFVADGRLGQKSGAGFYNYESGSNAPLPSDEAIHLIQAYAKKRGVYSRQYQPQEIVMRCVLALINEGANIVSESIVARSSDIDIVYVYGYGFPAYRGGPMFYADTVGLDSVIADLDRLAEIYPDRWKVSDLLRRLKQDGKKLSQYRAINVGQDGRT